MAIFCVYRVHEQLNDSKRRIVRTCRDEVVFVLFNVAAWKIGGPALYLHSR